MLGWEGGTSALAAVIVSAGVFPAPHFEFDFGAGVCVDVDGVSMCVPFHPLILVVVVKTLLKSKGVDMNCCRLVYGGRSLEDGALFANYGVQHGGSLFMFMALNGGTRCPACGHAGPGQALACTCVFEGLVDDVGDGEFAQTICGRCSAPKDREGILGVCECRTHRKGRRQCVEVVAAVVAAADESAQFQQLRASNDIAAMLGMLWIKSSKLDELEDLQKHLDGLEKQVEQFEVSGQKHSTTIRMNTEVLGDHEGRLKQLESGAVSSDGGGVRAQGGFVLERVEVKGWCDISGRADKALTPKEANVYIDMVLVEIPEAVVNVDRAELATANYRECNALLIILVLGGGKACAKVRDALQALCRNNCDLCLPEFGQDRKSPNVITQIDLVREPELDAVGRLLGVLSGLGVECLCELRAIYPGVPEMVYG